MAADLSKLATREVTELFLVANTPIYLYRRLRANESVKALADSATPLELAAAVAKIDRKRNRTPEDIATAYAAIVAATFHDSRAVHAAFDELQLRHLDWARIILQFWYDTLITTQERVVVMSPRPMEQSPASATPNRLIILPGGQQ